MSTVSSNTVTARSTAITGILCIEVAMLFFVTQDMFMKSLLQTYPIWMLIFVRSCIAILLLVPTIAILGAPHRLWTPLWPLHLLRAALFAVGFSLFYSAFPLMGLAEVTTIFFSAPLMTVLLAVVWLREPIGKHRAGALVVGFAGVIIAMNPTSDAFQWTAILPLICAFTYAISQVLVRQIGDRETSLTVGLYTLTFAGILILPMGWLFNQIVTIPPEFDHLRWEFPAETFGDLPRLCLLGATGMMAWLFLNRAYQIAPVSVVAPFDYTYLPLAAVVAYFLWNEVPPMNTIIGMGLIVAGGLYLGIRELRTAPANDEEPIVTDTPFVTGEAQPASLVAEDDHRP